MDQLYLVPRVNIDQQNQVWRAVKMRAMMINSTSGRIVNQKMRDQIYMKHLREVEKINNREAENIANHIKNYKSINELHHKHKSYAFEWHHKEEKNNIKQKNHQIKQKISQIRSYFQSKTQRKRSNQQQESSPCKLATMQISDKNPQQRNQQSQSPLLNNGSQEGKSMQKQHNKAKRQISLHYRYRQRRQEEIDRENTKLIKAIQSQRSSYLPKIYRSRQKNKANSKSIQKDSQEFYLETEQL